MRASAFTSSFIARLRMRRTPAAAQRAQQNGNSMSISRRNQTSADYRLRGSRSDCRRPCLHCVAPAVARPPCRLHDDGGARLRLRLQRLRRRRPRSAAGTRPRRPDLLRVLERRSDGELCRQLESSRRSELRQGNQNPMVQCRLQLQLQPRLGHDGADTHRQSHLDHRYWSVRRDRAFQQQRHRRH